ncbi:MAG TPA: protease modulator HflC [Gammaproteobacteria bacterium]|nr:protease modulator HflC [Gammaproteobacteria bacterium]
MGPRTSLTLILAVLGVIVVRMSLFTVDTREHAVKFRIGRIVDADHEPGLHFKIPFFENVAKYPNRVLIFDENSRERFLTGEKKNLIVDYYVNWRVVDPAQYYRAVRAVKETAEARLSAIVKEGIRAAIGRRTLQEVVSAERTELIQEMLIQVQERSPELGIEVVDVRVKRIDLADDVSESVFSRMRQERTAVATQLRAEGEEEYVRVRADADRQRTVILAEAYRDAERLRGAGEARAAEIYATAFARDRDFYAFYRSMQAYRESIGSDRDVLVLQPDSEFFKFLQNQAGSAN